MDLSKEEINTIAEILNESNNEFKKEELPLIYGENISTCRKCKLKMQRCSDTESDLSSDYDKPINNEDDLMEYIKHRRRPKVIYRRPKDIWNSNYTDTQIQQRSH